jgi:arylsulfatase A-like enzyme
MNKTRFGLVRGVAVPLALAAAVAASTCNGEPVGAPPPLQRLLPALGAPQIVQLGREAAKALPRRLRTLPRALGLETRPAVPLGPGQSVSCTVEAAPESLLEFALGLRPGAARHGALRLEVLAGRRSLYSAPLNPELEDRWQRMSLPIGQRGPVTLTFQVARADPSGHPLPAPDAAAEPWVLLGSPRVVTPPASGRILIWISQDTVRADHIGAYGYSRATTKHFDALAGDAVLFENGVSPASWTLPAMTSQFTSRYPSFHGAVTEAQSRDRSQPSVFETLSASGFTVLGLTGNLFVSDDFGLASGFDALWYSDRPAESLVLLAGRALENWHGEDLALLIHFQDAHHPYAPPAPFDTVFDPAFTGEVVSRDPKQLEHTKALYDGEIAYTDHEIQALLRGLKARGLFRQAVIVYTADHGEEFLDHGGWAHARTVYEELLHVPFALRVPDVPARRVPQAVSLLDVAPTVLDALGVPPPASFQGQSLLPFLRGRPRPWDPVYAETQRNSERHHLVAVRDGSLKYILGTRPGLASPPEILSEELYDLATDPGEKRPLKGSPELERMRRYALSYLARAAAEGRKSTPSRLTPEIEARLRALGYIQ